MLTELLRQQAGALERIDAARARLDAAADAAYIATMREFDRMDQELALAIEKLKPISTGVGHGR